MWQLLTFFLTLSLSVLSLSQLEAIGGRNEGFRGGERGLDEGNRAVELNHSPSMSRSIPQNFHLNEPSQKEEALFARPAGAETKATNPKALSQYIPKKAPKYSGKRDALAEIIRNQHTANNKDQKTWFDSNYWKAHPNSWYTHPEDKQWWAAASWTAVAGWLPWAWSDPIYYNYGPDGNIYDQGNSVYVDGEPVVNASDYAEQVTQLVNSIPAIDPAKMQWLPLGVFALTADQGQGAGALPNMYLQLAVSKEGVLAGTYLNAITNIDQTVQGIVDQHSQRAVWKIMNNGPVMETGMYNLTQSQAGLFVHFPDGTTQTWLMVRLNAPQG